MARKTVEANIAYDDIKQRYYVTLHYGMDAMGNRMKRTRCFPTLEQARLVRDNFSRARSIQGNIMPTGVTVGRWLDYWLDNVIRPHRAVTTTYGYQKIIDNHLKPYLGNVMLQSLTAMQVQRYMSLKLQEGLSANTIRKHHVLLNTAVGLAVRQDMLAKNVVQAVEPPPKLHPHHCFYAPDQLQRCCISARPAQPPTAWRWTRDPKAPPPCAACPLPGLRTCGSCWRACITSIRKKGSGMVRNIIPRDLW